jgi:hypothetical protein
MDFSEAPQPIDGVYPYLFAVRDLASHYQLAWQPVENERAETVIPLLQNLFQEYGPPLVLKSDQGSAFIAQVLGQLMQRSGAAQLFSPARTPQYNGALERSNGTLKTYTGLHAIREGHPFRWTSEDVEHARQLANTISRPWGHKGPTPADAWLAREPIGKDRRQDFQNSLRRNLPGAAADLGLEDTPLLAAPDRRRLDRLAISRTLGQLGYLTMKRQRRRKHRRNKQPGPATARCASSSTERVASAHGHRRQTTQLAAPPPCEVEKIRGMTRPLATSIVRVTMNAGTEARSVLPTDVRSRGSLRGERSIRSWLRRLITPPLRALKAARIL